MTTQPGFVAAFGAEWLKLITLRSARRNLVLGSVLGVLVSVALAFVMGETFNKWGVDERAEFDPILYSLTGAILTTIFFASVGANCMTSEYSSGMIRLTLVATPRRRRVILAKAAAVTTLTATAGLAVTVAMIGSSQIIYRAYGLPAADLWSADAARVLLAGTLTTPIFPLLAMCIAVLTRSTAATLTTVLVVMFVPSIVGAALPRWWQEHVVALLIGPASDALVSGHLTDVDRYLHPALAAAITTAWVVGTLAVAIAVFDRRDA